MTTTRWLTTVELALCVLPVTVLMVPVAFIGTPLAFLVAAGFGGDLTILWPIWGTLLGSLGLGFLGVRFLARGTWSSVGLIYAWPVYVVSLVAGTVLAFVWLPPVLLLVFVAGHWFLAAVNEDFAATLRAGRRYIGSDVEIFVRRAALPLWLTVWGALLVLVLRAGGLEHILAHAPVSS